MNRFRTLFAPLRGARTKLRTNYPGVSRVLSALFWLPMAVVLEQNIATVKLVTGKSMKPTLNPDDSVWRDLVLFNRFAIRVQQKLECGDIVALHSPDDSKLLVKRVVALPGDTIQTLPPYPDAEVRVPTGHIWVEGDESYHSEDSNRFGPVPLALVDSKLEYILFPFVRIGPITVPSPPKPNAKRDPAWRKQTDEVNRARRREARVTPAIP